ncbi:MAG: helix-turn-helix transcriptional regulator, partial [Planctomycetaceae bacterium]
MRPALEPVDGDFLGQLQRTGPQTVQQLCAGAGVTATAVRQRLTRLQGQGLVARDRIRQGRGRPHYVYRVTELGARQLGDNYGDLALILWRELHAIDDKQVRDAVTTRVREALVGRLGMYREGQIRERMRRLAESLSVRGYDVEIAESSGLPVLREHNCPYHELADQDREICNLERQVFEQ